MNVDVGQWGEERFPAPVRCHRASSSSDSSHVTAGVARHQTGAHIHLASELSARLTAVDMLDNSTRDRDSLANVLCSPLSFKRCAQSPTETTLPCSPCFVDGLYTKHHDSLRSPVVVSSHVDIDGQTLIQLPQRTVVSATIETVAIGQRTSSVSVQCSVASQTHCSSRVGKRSSRTSNTSVKSPSADSQQIRFIDDDSDGGNVSEDDAVNNGMCVWPASPPDTQPLVDVCSTRTVQAANSTVNGQQCSTLVSTAALAQPVQSKRITLLCCGIKHSPRSKSCKRFLTPSFQDAEHCTVSQRNSATDNRGQATTSTSQRTGKQTRPKSASLPASPVHQGSNLQVTGKNLSQSNHRRLMKKSSVQRSTADSSDEDTVPTASDYTNLESFQKARFNRKVCMRIMVFCLLFLLDTHSD